MAKQGKPPLPPNPVVATPPIAAGSTPTPRFTPRALLGGAFLYRRYILGGAVVVYGAGRFVSSRLEKAKRDFVDPNGTIIYWNVDGGIVEEKDSSSLYVASLLFQS